LFESMTARQSYATVRGSVLKYDFVPSEKNNGARRGLWVQMRRARRVPSAGLTRKVRCRDGFCRRHEGSHSRCATHRQVGSDLKLWACAQSGW
jgi:hypothetical protein